MRDGVSGLELIDALLDLAKSTDQPIIAIDGPAGAGKTTLATHLSAALSLKYKCTIIHMDQIYNGWNTPFDEHFTQALIQIVKAHKKAEAIPLAQYNWHHAASRVVPRLLASFNNEECVAGLRRQVQPPC